VHILLGGAGLILVALCVVLVTFSDEIVSKVQSSTRLKRALEYRTDAWANSLEIIKEHKVLGVGLNTFLSVKKFAPGSKFSHEMTAPHPHNLLLYVAQSCGLPALAVFLALLGGFIYYTVVVLLKLPDPEQRRLVIGCVAGAAALLSCGLMDLGLSLVTLFPGPLWMFMGIVSSIHSLRFSRLNQVDLGGLRAVLPVAALVLAILGAFILPTTGRVLLKRSALAAAYETQNEINRLGEMALAADPLLAQAREYMYRRYLDNGRLDKAYEFMEEAIRLQPENAALFEKMGVLLEDLDQIDKAVIHYRKAVNKDHGSVNLARYYAKLINAETQCCKTEVVKGHLKAAIRRNIAVINMIDWSIEPHPAGRDDQFLKIPVSHEMLRLEDVLNEIHGELQAGAEQGLPQDRFDWFSIYQAYYNAFIYDRALAVLDDIERIFGDRERATINLFRGIIAEEKGDLDGSKTFLSQAERIKDRTNPSANLYFQSRMIRSLMAKDEADLGRAIADQKKTISNFRDLSSSGETYAAVLDMLIDAYERSNDSENMIEPLKSRIFFYGTKQEKFPHLLRLARSLKLACRFEEAEKTILDTLDSMAVQQKRMAELEPIRRRKIIEEEAILLAQCYEAMGLSKAESIRRYKERTDAASSNPSRILFKCHFMVRCGRPEEALATLELVLMDEKKLLFLLELFAECCHMVDDMDRLRLTYKAIEESYKSKGIVLEARCTGLFAAVFEDLTNVDLIHELALNKSYIGKLDHSHYILTTAIRQYHPDEARLYLLAARIYRLDRKPQDSLAALETAVEKDPDNYKARITYENLLAHLNARAEVKNSEGEGP
jgi:tetratricopeptide (TPR) repeat protein